MAKIFWIAEKDGDSIEMFAFNNKRKAQQKAMELAPHFSFGDNKVPKDEDDDLDMFLYSGTINAKNCFILYREGGMPYAKGDFADASEAYSWMEEKGRKVVAGACFPVKLKGGMCSIDIWDQVGVLTGTELFKFDKYVENDPDFDWYADEVGADGKPLQMYASKTILESFKYVPTFESFIGSQKVNENFTLLDAFDEYGWSDEYDGKYFPITNALNGLMDDLVWITDNFPDFIQEEGKLVKTYQMKGLDSPEDYDGNEVEDPHGDVDFSLYKYKGLKIGWFTDDYGYSAGLCHERDVKKWTKIIKDMGEEEYLDVF